MRLAVLSWRDLDHPRAGGSEVYVQRLTRLWASWGHDVTLVCAAVAGQPARTERDGYRIVRGGGRLGVYRAARHVYLDTLRGCVDAVIDVINTRPFLTPGYVEEPVIALAFQVADDVWPLETPPIVSTIGRRILEPRWLARYARTPTLTISPSSRDSLLAYGLRDVRVVPVGVDPPPPGHTAKAALPTIVFVGRLAANKRPDHAIEAFRHVERALPGARLWIIGDGPLRSRLERSAPPGVTFYGRIEHDRKQQLMSAAHALVATSVREGWGLTVSEAALLGTRSVAYDVAGLRDSVPAAGGLLVRPDPASLAAQLVARLPGWQAEGHADLGDAGVVGWEETARVVLDEVAAVARGRRDTAEAAPR